MGKKKCIISHHKTLKINVNDAKLHWLRSQVFFLFYFCRFHQLPPFDYSFDEYTHAYSDINFFTEPLIEQICG